jgi:ABC-type glycerol-3-phosphate transport system permease component
MKKKREILERRRTPGERIFFIVAFLVLALWSVIVLFMFFWALMNVFKTNIDYLREPLAMPKPSGCFRTAHSSAATDFLPTRPRWADNAQITVGLPSTTEPLFFNTHQNRLVPRGVQPVFTL